MSLIELSKIASNKQQAAKAFRKQTWKRGFGCVKCGSVKVWKHNKLKNGLQKYRCCDCKHVFSDQSQTRMRYNKIHIHKVAIILKCLTIQKLATPDIAQLAETSIPATFNLLHKARKQLSAFYLRLTQNKQLEGCVEMDETRICSHWLWGGISRNTGHVIIDFVNHRSEFELSKRIWKHVREGSTILTDEWKGYQPHPRFYSHYTVNHSQTFTNPLNPLIHTNRIEGFRSQLKRLVNRFHNGVSKAHLHLYLNTKLFFQNYHSSSKSLFNPFSLLLIHCQPHLLLY